MRSILDSAPADNSKTNEGRGIVTFLLVTFGLAWIMWIPLWVLSVPVSSDVYSAGVMIGLFAPALGTLIVRLLITREGFADAGLRPNLPKAWPYYLLAWLWPLLIYGALRVAVQFGLATRQDISADIVPALWSALLMTLPLWGEEFGWRGYLQLRLFRGRPLLAAVATGAIWGVWHYPVVVSGYLSNQHGIAGLIAFPAYNILFSILLGWLVIRTGSVWPACLAHAANNMVLEAISRALFDALPGNGDVFLDPRGWIVVVPMAALSAWIILTDQLNPRLRGGRSYSPTIWTRTFRSRARTWSKSAK